MQNLHLEAARQHQLAARAHRTVAERNEKGDNPSANWHTNEDASIPIEPTNWRKKLRASQER
jgi:hypothetical protein